MPALQLFVVAVAAIAYPGTIIPIAAVGLVVTVAPVRCLPAGIAAAAGVAFAVPDIVAPAYWPAHGY